MGAHGGNPRATTLWAGGQRRLHASCSICLEGPDDGAEARFCRSCGGSFCVSCITQWIDSSVVPSCPLCRAAMSGRTLVRLVPTAGRPVEDVPEFKLDMLVEWLMMRRCQFTSAAAINASSRCRRIVHDAVGAIDNLLVHCSEVCRLGAGAPQLLCFCDQLPTLRQSFQTLFDTVDLALSHAAVAQRYAPCT